MLFVGNSKLVDLESKIQRLHLPSETQAWGRGSQGQIEFSSPQRAWEVGHTALRESFEMTLPHSS